MLRNLMLISSHIALSAEEGGYVLLFLLENIPDLRGYFGWQFMLYRGRPEDVDPSRGFHRKLLVFPALAVEAEGIR